MVETPQPETRRWTRPRLAVIALIALAVVFLVALLVAPRVALSRQRVERILSDYFDSEVELASFTAHVLPRPRVEGAGLVLRWKGRMDLPPLIKADRFVIESSLAGTLQRPTRIRLVRFEVLEINVPPNTTKQLGGTAATSGRAEAQTALDHRNEAPSKTPVIIDRFEADESELVIWPDEADKEPLRFALHRLRLDAVALDRPLSFGATLTNPNQSSRPSQGSTRSPMSIWQPSRVSAERCRPRGSTKAASSESRCTGRPRRPISTSQVSGGRCR
jgi:hypothetical protein